MNKLAVLPEVLTLEEAARYLRLPRRVVEQLASEGQVPGRLVEKRWRFLKAALNDWLRTGDQPGGRTRMLEQFGAFADDKTLPQLIEAIYKERGRPEREEGAAR